MVWAWCLVTRGDQGPWEAEVNLVGSLDLEPMWGTRGPRAQGPAGVGLHRCACSYVL